MTYPEATAFIWALTDYERRTGYDYSASRFDLGRVAVLLSRLGEPQSGMALAHVAGTKGKGSTSAMLASIFSRTGRRIGLYTSPHLHTVRERIQVNGQPLRREEFSAAVALVAEAMESGAGITSFEALTAAAFVAFSRADVEVAVIEVGLGGRLDATNVINPFVSIITSLSLDHTAVLGPTLEEIAAEKAGIIKPGVPVVSACQQAGAARVLAERATRLECELEVAGLDWRYTCGPWGDNWQEFSLDGTSRDNAAGSATYRLPLLGVHQVENATLALAAARRAPAALGLRHEHMVEGLARVSWPGRFEVVRRAPYLVLDGAHNGDSMAKLCAALARHTGGGERLLVFGASRDKDASAMLAPMVGEGTRLFLCQSGHGRSAVSEDVAAAALAAGLPHRSFGSVAEALWSSLDEASERDCVCVTGSLFVVAEAREAIARRCGVVDESEGEAEVLSLVR